MNGLLKRGASVVALSYLVISLVWILFSDKFTEAFFGHTPLLSEVQTLKGFLFVFITAALLYFLIKLLLAKQNEYLQLVRASERTYRTLFNKNPNAMLVVEPGTLNILDSNLEAKGMFGMALKSLYCHNLKELFRTKDHDALESWLQEGQRRIGDQDSRSFTLKDYSGRLFEIDLSTYPVAKKSKPAFLLILRDITETRRQLKTLKNKFSRIDSAREISGLGVWEINLHTQKLSCCNNVQEMMNLTPSDGASESLSLSSVRESMELPIFDQIVAAVLKTPYEPVSWEQEVTDQEGKTRFLLIYARYQEDGNTRRVIGSFIDVSEQKSLEIRLRRREEQYRNLVDLLPEGVMLFANYTILYANKAAKEMLGTDQEDEILGQSILRFVLEDTMESVKNRIAGLLQGNRSLEKYMKRNLKRVNGERFQAEIAARLMHSGEGDAIQIIIRDLTEPLKMQEALEDANERLASLSSHTLELMELERQHIAGELHDDVGQSLTAIKLGVKWLAKRATNPEKLAKLNELGEIAGETLDRARNLSLKLRPAQLDSRGLSAAIAWQAKMLLENTAIQFYMDDLGLQQEPEEGVDIIAFRVVQEALTNIVKHAMASSVEVALKADDNTLKISIIDDGRGFDEKMANNTFGLLNMKERVKLANGKIEIKSLMNVGTEIRFELPMHKTDIQHRINQQRLLAGVASQ